MLAKPLFAALVALPSSTLAAAPYPDHPITLIVPYAPGGSSDVLARLIGEPLSKSLLDFGGQMVDADRIAQLAKRDGDIA